MRDEKQNRPIILHNHAILIDKRSIQWQHNRKCGTGVPWNKSSVEQEKGYHCDGRSENGETSTWKQQAMGTMISHGKRTTLGRRAFLWRILAGTAGVAIGTLMSSCSNASSRRLDEEPKPAPAQPTSTGSKVFSEPDHTPTLATSTGSKIMLAYFSRAGENYYYGGTNTPRCWEHRSPGGHDQPAHRVRRPPHRSRRSLPRRLSGNRRAQRPGTRGRCPSSHREPAGLQSSLTISSCWAVRSGTSELP